MRKENLIRIRKEKGFTQQQIAEIIPTDVSNYSRKESGTVKITQNELEKIATFLDVPIELLNDDNPEEESIMLFNKEYLVIIKRYIAKLEAENVELREKIEKMREVLK